MLWIYQAQSNDVRWLQERNVHIWDEWEIREDGTWQAKQNIMRNGHYIKENVVKKFSKEDAHTIGTAYGYITKRYDMARSLINSIKNCPTARRKVFSLWQNEFLRTAVLPSCVWSTEWNIYKDTLNLEVHQRSCDVPLGLPFNVTRYATLLKMIAQVTDLEPGFVSYSINEPHIYVNQLDGIKEQLRRAETYEYLKDKSELELLCEERGNLLQMKNLDKNSKEYQILDSDNKIIDILFLYIRIF